VIALLEGSLKYNLQTELNIATIRDGIGDVSERLGNRDTTRLGNLSVGSVADISLLSAEKGKFGFTDSLGGRLEGDRKLVCELTVRNGLMVSDLNGISREPWQNRTEFHSNSTWHGTLPARRSMLCE
jgi:hypothetical protein